MASPIIQIRRSAVAGKIPTTTQLSLGELALNTYDGKLYLKQDQGGVGIGTTVIAVNPWSVGLGTNAYNTFFTVGNVGVGNTLPTSRLSVTGDASISGILTADQVYTSNNGNGTNIRIGDDLWIGDINVANTTRFSGAQNSDRAFIVFGNSNTVALGRTAAAALYYGGDFTVAGVVTATTFSGQVNAGVGTITTLSGTTASYGTINVTTGNIVTGIITNAQGTNLNYTGISTISNALATNLNVSGVGTFLSSGLKIRNSANTFQYNITGGAIAADRTLNLPVITGIDTVATLGLSQTFGATNTYTSQQNFDGGATFGAASAFNSTLNVNSQFNASGQMTLIGSATGDHRFGSTQTTGTLTFGGTAGVGTITFGRSTATQQTDIQAGASGVGTTKTINFGTGGLSGSFTQINIGPTAGVGTVTINSGTNLGIGSVSPTSALTIIGDTLTTGVITATSFNGTINATTGNIVTGVITNAQGTNLNYSGIATVGSLNIGATQVISSGRQLQNISSLDATTTATIESAIAAAPNNFNDLNVTGISTFTNGPVLIGSGTSTGTASQPLQVTGGAYVSGNLGIGTVNPTEKVSVLGRVQIQQDAGSNNRLIFRGQPSSLFRWNIDNNGASNDFRIFREDDATTANGVVYLGISTGGNVTATTFSGTTVNATTGNVVTGVITNAQGTNINYSGVGTIGTLNSTTGTVTTLSGTTASYGTLNVTTGNIVTGVITNAQGTNINYSGVGTIATFNATSSSVTNRTGTNLNISGVGTIPTLNSTSGTITTLSGTTASYSTGNFTTGNIVTGIITNAQGTNINYSGIGTIGTLNSTTGTITTLSGTTASYGTANITTGNIVTGIITNAQGTNINYSGIGTIGTLNSTTGTITTLSGTTASYGTINATTGNIVTGIITNAQGTNINYSGIGTITTFNATSSAVTNRTGTNLNISGVGTIPTLNSTTINATTSVITNAQGTNLNYSGISTLGSVLSGNINSSGVVTATSFVGSGANLTSLNATQLTSGTVPGARITSSGGDFTVGNNLFVNGVLSVGGTSVILNAAQLRINDRDITLGITTDALGNDVSNDNTANHGGIAIASTVGTPIINIPVDAVNTDPSTYKQIMWVKQGHYSGLGTDAWVLNYGVSIGNTATVQTGSRLTVGAGFTVYDTVVDLQNLRTVNINSSGIGTIPTLNSTSGTITTLSGTTASYGTLNVTTGNIVTGVITNAQGTNINYSGIGTIATFNATSSSVTNRTGTNLNISGVGTIPTLNSTTGTITTLSGTTASYGTINVTTGNIVTGVITNAQGTNINYSGIGTIATLGSTTGTITTLSGTTASYTTGNFTTGNIVTGIITNAQGTNINYSGVGTIATLNSTTGTITTLSGTTASYGTANITTGNIVTGIVTNVQGTNLNYSGIATVGSLNIGATQVISAARQLQNIASLDATTTATIEAAVANAPNTFTDLNVTGISTFTNGPILVGGATSTGTATQRLQVTGGGYISTNTGIGVTNPTSLLQVQGNALITGIATVNSNLVVNGNTLVADATNNRVGILTVTPIQPFQVGSTAGTSFVVIDTLGDLGIGTTNPTSKLQVVGDARFTGVVTATTSVITNEQGTNINFSGISTFGTLRIASGIVTATSGIITYYGDASKLSNIVGSTISSTAPSNPTGGTLWFNSELGRTFVYYDETVIGAGGTDKFWIDAAPFNVGIITTLSNVSFASGTATNPSWYFTNSATTGVFSPAAGFINFVSVGSTVLSINSGGLNVTGVVTATDFNSTSDIMLKENIHSISNPLEKVMQINGVGFRWKDSKEPSMGVIAQDIEEVLPELVHSLEHFKTVNYNGLIGVLIEAVKEQQRQIEELKALINK